ncbi:MAG TPA: A/G-specific adenine glycosylase [Rhizobiaceae bacterium]
MALTAEARKGAYQEDNGLAGRLLAWYDAHHRDLPWRVAPAALAKGLRPDPYHVWLSEIMLQQTTVEAVKPYFRKFLEKWPGVVDLAAAEQDEVMKAWAGLGYYSRARNLKKCADLVVAELGGRFPDDEAGLRRLPGIGAYTAAAIAAIAFARRAVVIDGNVERVMSRLFEIRTPLPEAKPEIRVLLEGIVPADRPGDFAQAMMDLGATVCTPKRPRCMICPVRDGCRAILAGDPELLPVKGEKATKPLRRGAAYVAVREDGAILLKTRPDKGLLGGMSEVPTTGWTARVDGDTTTGSAPFAADWRRAGTISHVFTHFALELVVYQAEVNAPPPVGHWWSTVSAVHDEALPTVMKKVIESAIPGATKRGH